MLSTLISLHLASSRMFCLVSPLALTDSTMSIILAKRLRSSAFLLVRKLCLIFGYLPLPSRQVVKSLNVQFIYIDHNQTLDALQAYCKQKFEGQPPLKLNVYMKVECGNG